MKRPPPLSAFGAAGDLLVVRRQVPAWVMDPEPYRPEIVLLMDAVTGLVVNVSAFKPSESVEGPASWIVDQVAGLPRHLPHRRLRTNDHELAPLLRERLADDWDVVVAATPEAEEALASLAASLTTAPGAGGHFADGATPGMVGRFFAAAAPVFRAAPWRVATDAEVLAVNAPQFGYDGACLSIIGALGENFGVLIHASMEDYLSVLRMAIRGAPVKGLGGAPTFAVNFDLAAGVPRRFRQEAKRHGWPVERGGFPTISHIDPDAVLHPLGERDYAFAAALLAALLRFLVEHGRVFADHGLPEPVQARYEDETGAVVLTAPHPRATWRWGESAEAAALAMTKRQGARPRRRGPRG